MVTSASYVRKRGRSGGLETKDDNPITQTPQEFAFESRVDSKEAREVAREKLKECYQLILDQMDKYMDMSQEYRTIVALWIVGTYFHKTFSSYPFLFVNAMRGSGKTRLLKFIEAVCCRGKITNALTESVLFRTAEHHSILIDEFEAPGSKEKNLLRELLNSAYKRGSYVERMQKRFTKEGEEQQVQRFKLYTPVVMANIWGMEEVLGDRCITLVLEKSDDPHKTKLMEDFDIHPIFKYIRKNLELVQCSLCNVVTEKNTIERWNYYLDSKYTPTYITYIYNNYNKLHKQPEELKEHELETFNRIDGAQIDGRNLELFFPLFLISQMISSQVFDETITLAKRRVKEKKEYEFVESRDVSLIDFVASQNTKDVPIQVAEFTYQFKKAYQDEDEDGKWLNSRWMGRALKRLKLIKHKQRVPAGIIVILDVEGAKRRIRAFKTDET